MPVFYIPYVIADKQIIQSLVSKGYIEDKGNQIGYCWTEKGLAVYDEFTQNLANLG